MGVAIRCPVCFKKVRTKSGVIVSHRDSSGAECRGAKVDAARRAPRPPKVTEADRQAPQVAKEPKGNGRATGRRSKASRKAAERARREERTEKLIEELSARGIGRKRREFLNSGAYAAAQEAAALSKQRYEADAEARRAADEARREFYEKPKPKDPSGATPRIEIVNGGSPGLNKRRR